MNNPVQIIFSALTLLGVGGIVGGYITFLLDKKKEREFKVLEQKKKVQILPFVYGRIFWAEKH